MHQKVGRRGVRKARLCDVRADWLGWAESQGAVVSPVQLEVIPSVGRPGQAFWKLVWRGRHSSSSFQEWRSPAVRLGCKSHTENEVSDTQQRPQTWGDPTSKLIIYRDFICFPGKWILAFSIAVLDNSPISCFRGGWKHVVHDLHLGNSCLMAGMHLINPKQWPIFGTLHHNAGYFF